VFSPVMVAMAKYLMVKYHYKNRRGRKHTRTNMGKTNF